MTLTVQELIDELQDLVDKGEVNSNDVLMLNVAGRWTGIKGTSFADGILFIDSED